MFVLVSVHLCVCVCTVLWLRSVGICILLIIALCGFAFECSHMSMHTVSCLSDRSTCVECADKGEGGRGVGHAQTQHPLIVCPQDSLQYSQCVQVPKSTHLTGLELVNHQRGYLYDKWRDCFA